MLGGLLPRPMLSVLVIVMDAGTLLDAEVGEDASRRGARTVPILPAAYPWPDEVSADSDVPMLLTPDEVVRLNEPSDDIVALLL